MCRIEKGGEEEEAAVSVKCGENWSAWEVEGGAGEGLRHSCLRVSESQLPQWALALSMYQDPLSRVEPPVTLIWSPPRPDK